MFDNIVIDLDKDDGVSEGGILLPDKVQQKLQTGVVLAVGPGRVPEYGVYKGSNDVAVLMPSVETGDRVVFSKYAANEVAIDRKVCYIISEQSIFGVVE